MTEKQIKQNSKVAVILLNYNKFELTRDCIESLLRTGYAKLEIIVIDNGSEENDKNKLAKFCSQYDEVFLETISPNIGFIKGNNLGLKLALNHKADFVWILNNDTIVDPSAIDVMISCFNTYKLNKSQTLLSPIITYYRSNVIWCNGMFDLPLVNFPKSKDKGIKVENLNKTALYIQKSMYNCSCSTFLHKEFVNKHGLINEKYFMYYDDLDYSLGKDNYYVQLPLVQHRVSATTGFSGSETFSNFQAYLHGKNAILFYFGKKKINMLEKFIFLSFTMWVIIALYIRSWDTFIRYLTGIKDGLKLYKISK